MIPSVSSKELTNIGAYIHNVKNTNIVRIVAQIPRKSKYISLAKYNMTKQYQMELADSIPDNFESYNRKEWNNFKNRLILNLNPQGEILEHSNNRHYLMFELKKTNPNGKPPKNIFFINGKKINVNDKNLPLLDKLVMFLKDTKGKVTDSSTNVSVGNKDLFINKLVPQECSYSQEGLNYIYDTAMMKHNIQGVIDETLEAISDVMHNYFGVYNPKAKPKY